MIRKISCIAFAILLISSSRYSFSQNLVQNGDFNANAANWNFFAPATAAECNNFETTYGGTVATNHVAEIDFGSNIRQTNIPVTPGNTYVISLRHSRRDIASNPNNINVKVYNGATTFLTQDIASSNAAWLWQCKTFTFVPTTTSIDLDIKNVTPGNTATLGTIIDDVTIILQQQIITSSGSVCPGGNVTLTAPVSTPGATYTNYSWTGPNGFAAVGNTTTITNVQAAQTGTYTCTMNVNGCASVSGTFSVQLLPKPDVTLTSTDTINICPGGSADISLANPIANNAYQWFKDNVMIAGATNSILTVNASGDYKVVVTSAAGCTDTSQAVHATFNSLNADFAFTLHKACTSDTVVFHNLSDSGQYFWSFGDMTLESTATNPTHIYQSQNVYVVRLKVVSSKGCVDSVIKTVDITHPFNAAFIQSVDTICLGQGLPVAFTDASVGDISNWNWNFGESNPSTAQNPAYTFTQAGSHTIRLIVKENDLPCFDTAYSSIQVDAVPYFNITQDKHVICAGQALNFDTDFDAATIKNIAWNFGDGTQWNQLEGSAHRYENPGIYWISVDADFGVCGISHDIDSIVVNQNPVVNLGSDNVLCLDGPAITVGDLNNASDPSVTWLWNTGASTPSIEIAHPGMYSLTATKNECATTETIEVNKDCYTDIPNVFTPNGDGVNDYFYPRQLLSKGVVGFSMNVFNRWGQKVFESTTMNGRGWDGKFNNKNQPMGVYIYQIKAVLQNGRNENYTGNVTLMR
jgi:gliding motility-associated-like protein